MLFFFLLLRAFFGAARAATYHGRLRWAAELRLESQKLTCRRGGQFARSRGTSKLDSSFALSPTPAGRGAEERGVSRRKDEGRSHAGAELGGSPEVKSDFGTEVTFESFGRVTSEPK